MGCTIYENGLSEHGGWAYPERLFTVQGAVEDQWLQRFAVTDKTQHLVVMALVVAVAATGNGGQGR